VPNINTYVFEFFKLKETSNHRQLYVLIIKKYSNAIFENIHRSFYDHVSLFLIFTKEYAI